MNSTHEKLINKVKEELSDRFLETGHTLVPSGLINRVLLNIKSYLFDYCGFIKSSSLTNLSVAPLGKKCKRYQIVIIATYKLPKNLSSEDKKNLKSKRVKDIYGIKIINKSTFQTTERYSLLPSGSPKASIYGSLKVINNEFQYPEETLLPIVTTKKQRQTEELEKLKKIIGKKGLNALKKGHTLQIWRRSQPFNWFIQDNNNTVYHSESGQVKPSLRLFEKVEDSKEIISVPTLFFSIPGNGQPELTTYKLKKEYLKMME